MSIGLLFVNPTLLGTQAPGTHTYMIVFQHSNYHVSQRD